MRRKDREVSIKESIDLLKNAEYGVLSTASEDGRPYGVPLNFCFINSCIYFHCALEGHKIDNIEQNKYVSFCVVGRTKILPEEFATEYESAIAFGECKEVFGEEKHRALEGLLSKYSPQFMDKGKRYIDKFGNKTRVFKIEITELTGKARR